MAPNINALLKLFQPLFDENIESISLLSGGDIGQSFLITTSNCQYFAKVYHHTDAEAMLAQEKQGLQLIRQSAAIKTPEVFSLKKINSRFVLLLEYITPGANDAKSQKALAHGLAKLHQSNASYFGLSCDNFIGGLSQSNSKKTDWADFYICNRLEPQLVLAYQNNLLNDKDFPKLDKIDNFIRPYLADVRPTLLHGDLWSGNYIINQNNEPFLIDPAVYYGHSEVDLAMTELFGGFSEDFYRVYNEYHPIDKGYQVRKDFYQLYYLLVHLNLFGDAYTSAVWRVMNKYF